MSIKVISDDHLDCIKRLFADATKEIQIICPFIGLQLTNELCSYLKKNPDIKCTVITRFYRGDFTKGVSSLEALSNLLNYGAQIYILKELHTKLYLFDDNCALLGSANFTSGGFSNNHELSLLIKDEDTINSELKDYAATLLQKIQQLGDYLVTRDKLAEEIIFVEGQKEKSSKAEQELDNTKQGADIKIRAPLSLDEDVLDSITDDQATDAERGYWLKFEGASNDRRSLDETYDPLILPEYPEGITCFSDKGHRIGIADGDIIYLALISKDQEGYPVPPVIIGRGETYGYREANKATKEMIDRVDWLEDYPLFVAYKKFEYLKDQIGNGIMLTDLLAKVGTKTYPTSYNEDRNFEALKRVHKNRSHLRLTKEAKDYLDAAFAEKAREQGNDKDFVASEPYIKSIEKEFSDEMYKIYKTTKNELNYNARYFYDALVKNGALNAAKKFIHNENAAGFAILWEKNRLDLSIEAKVIEKKYSSLFSDEEIKMCEKRLDRARYKLP